jgi:hypothetical protein
MSLIDVCSKNICENELKINLIYQRLNENSCCPICYQVFNDINNKIYKADNKCFKYVAKASKCDPNKKIIEFV